MLHDPIPEARRQIEICNACRYCEGYCAVFPAMTRNRSFAEGDITHLANLCHNCRGCHYACQYAPPHDFALNLPQALAEVRADSWERFIRPRRVARLFQRHGVALASGVVLALAAIFWALAALRPAAGEGFYAHMSHAVMVAIFLPAFLGPLAVIALGLRRYWRAVGAGPLRPAHLMQALRDAAQLRNLSGGQGQGCTYEAGDRFSDARRRWHHLVFYGFLLCFASTSAGTVMHYAFDWPAPYPWWSLPKLLGVPGGLMMVAGCAGLLILRRQADPALGSMARSSGEVAFVLLLGAVAASGLALYAATGSALVAPLLALHLGTVLAFFLLMPFSKMVHGFFRLAALAAEAGKRQAG